MIDITELAQSLKASAENAGADYWQAKKISGDFYVIRKGSYKRECGYTTYQPIAEIDHKPTRDYVAMANPANVITLIEALEKAQRRIAELENYAEAEAVGADRAAEDGVYWMKRCKELESRTVKLPEPFELAGLSGGLSYYYADEVDAALTAQGIKVEAE